MAPALATKRLSKELVNLKKDPPPGVIAEPQESDILTWYYAIRGPADTAYQGGHYIGKIKFSPEYPLKAPSIYMLTPSGRFKISTKLCMSMSDFHPESWNPLWSVATIIQGIQSFMASDELTTGGLKASDADRKRFASVSMAYNTKNYSKLFGGNILEAFEEADAARVKADKVKVVDDGATTRRRRRTRTKKKEEEVAVEEEEITAPKELNAEEVEKRRQKNAKKRAKQKAKKAAAKQNGDLPVEEMDSLDINDVG